MDMRPVPPQSYPAVVSLVAEAPATLDARAYLLAGDEAVSVYANDTTSPTVATIEWASEAEHVVTFVGDWDPTTLAAYVRALERPATLRAPASIAERLPALRSDLVAHRYITFRALSEANTRFDALPPGGVRRLRPADARGLGAAIPQTVWGTYGTAAAALRDGMAYARYLRAEIVSIACVAAHTEHYARIAAYTIARARRNGFATECGRRLIGALIAEWHASPLLTGAAEDAPAHALARSIGLMEADTWTTYALQ